MYSLTPCCFLCLQQISKNYKPKEGKIALQEIKQFYDCEEVHEDEDQNIPIFMCASCRMHLDAYYIFKKRFLSSLNRWRKFVSNLQQNSRSSESHEYKNLKVSLVDFKQLLDNNLSSNYNKTKFRNMNISQRETLENRNELLSDMQDSVNMDENNKKFESNECKTTPKEVITDKIDLTKNSEEPNILNKKLHNIDLDFDNAINETNAITGNKMKETVNEKTGYDASVDLQYEIMYIEGREIVKNEFHNNHSDYESSINDQGIFKIKVDYHSESEKDLNVDANIETIIDKNYIITEESLDIDFKEEITSEVETENIFISEDINSDCKNDINDVNIKIETDTYLRLLNSDYIMEEESLDIKDEIQTTSEDEIILISEDNFDTIERKRKVDQNSTNMKTNNKVSKTFKSNLQFIETQKSDDSISQSNELENNDNIGSKTVDKTKFHFCKFCDNNVSKRKLKRHIQSLQLCKFFEFCCVICNRKFFTKDKLYKHIEYHDKAYNCIICHKQFSKTRASEEHIEIQFGKNEITSDDRNENILISEDNFDTTERKNKVLKVDQNSTNMKTNNKVSKTAQESNDSICQCTELENNDNTDSKTVNKIKYHFCKFCDKSFISKNKLKRHIHSLHPFNQFDFCCVICNRKYFTKDKLYKHIKYHDKAYNCTICHKRFSTTYTLEQHIKIHSVKKEITSDDKNENILTSEDVLIINSDKTKNKVSKLDQNSTNVCTFCNNSFVSRRNLIRHINSIHSNQPEFRCVICNKKFNRKDKLNNHIKIHDKAFNCIICHKQFSMTCHLKEHLKIHFGDKPFQCEICKKTFRQKSNYEVHLRVHSGAKPFSCEFCEKSFVSSNDMIRHRRIHTQDFKHQCSECDKKFNEKSHLKRHLKVHQKKKKLLESQK